MVSGEMRSMQILTMSLRTNMIPLKNVRMYWRCMGGGLDKAQDESTYALDVRELVLLASVTSNFLKQEEVRPFKLELPAREKISVWRNGRTLFTTACDSIGASSGLRRTFWLVLCREGVSGVWGFSGGEGMEMKGA